MLSNRKHGIYLILTMILIYPATQILVLYAQQKEKFLGEFTKGRDVIRIGGQLFYIDEGEKKPIINAKVELYANFSDGSWIFLGENTTDSYGYFLFVVRVDNRFPAGEVIFTVYFPGDIAKAYEPVRMYYRAIIREPKSSNISSMLGILIVGILIFMMIVGMALSLRKMLKQEYRSATSKTWLDVLDEIIKRASRKEFGFIMLIGELIDSLCKHFGKIPKASMTFQEKLLLIRENITEETYNILKNMVSLYEIQLYGGPYARTILMNTLDYETWKQLLAKIREELTSR